MCGLAGIIGRVDDANRAALARMATAVAHRGPDAEGFWESPADQDGRGCLLAHRRLSIIDLSDAAHQPMTDPVGGQTLVFNGEIYNFAALRDDLHAAGHTFDSSGDTAVLARLLATEGTDACGHLRGMYAFATWDPASRRLTVARDPHGIKPLYLCPNPDPEGEWSLLVASELRAILASGLIGRPRLDPRAVASVVWNGYVAGPVTAVQGVSALPPGTVHTYDERGREVGARTFWAMPSGGAAGSGTLHDLRTTRRDTVAAHLVAEGPVGVFLSGGVESSAVANLAQRARPDQRVRTFALAFEEDEYNEGHHARAVAEAIGTEHHEIVLTEGEFVAHLDQAIATLDQPTFDGLNSYFMSRTVREAGRTVALVGTGGDELFGGYTTFRDLPRLSATVGRAARVSPALARRAAELFVRLKQRGDHGGLAPQSRWAKLPDMAAAGDDLLALYQLSYALFLPSFQRELLADDLGPGGPEALVAQGGLAPELRARITDEVRHHGTRSALSVMEQRCFLGERLLPDTDAASMAVSLELRLPLVDSVLTEQVGRLDAETRYEPVGRKQALRDVGLDGLDPALFDRPKRGFEMPFDRWIRQNLGGQMDELMGDASAAAAVGLDGAAVTRLWGAYRSGAPGIYWSRVWAVYILMRWSHAHGVVL